MASTSEDRIAELEAELLDARQRQLASSQALETAENRIHHLEAVLETVPVGVVLADNEGRIFHGNSLVEELVRHPVLHSDDVDSYGEWVSFHEDGRRVESHEYPLSRVIRDGEERSEVDVHYQRGDGARFWLRIIGRPILGSEGQRIGASVALINIDRERQLQNGQQILIGELNHRVKNAFSVVKAIVNQSLRSLTVDETLRSTIDERLDAYARAHSKLIGTEWDKAPVGEVISDIVTRTAPGRIACEGPEVSLPSRQALALSMATYELSTNAIKYGSLSDPDGTVSVRWSVDETATPPQLRIEWLERGGPSPVTPTTKGFGAFIIDRAMTMETSGEVDLAYPGEGFEWRLTMPVQNAGAALQTAQNAS